MKTFIKTIAIAIVAMVFGFNSANAQNKNAKVSNTLEGVWVMEKIITDGKKDAFICGEFYSRVKVYGNNGEYCCAEILMNKEGIVTVLPHEYGTYSYKNGKYTECGRVCGDDAIVWSGENSFHGRWMKNTEYWNRNPKFPNNLRNHILSTCKLSLASKSMQSLMKQYILNKK